MECKRLLIFIFSVSLLLQGKIIAAEYISDQKLWSHVVTIDRLAWQERNGTKKINKIIQRIYSKYKITLKRKCFGRKFRKR